MSFFVLLISCHLGHAQNQISPIPYFSYGKGLGITSPDSLFMLNIRFRMQNRLGLISEAGSNMSIDEVEARVRRLRLRFDGFIYTPKLNYVIQLAFTRADMDYDDTGFPNIVRDAMVQYAVNKHFSVGFGQTKLPGNRQRINSSGDLQLPDRSIVNATFNIDRDFGIQLYYNNSIRALYYILRGAISSGDGRNITASGRGLAYTGRVELQPLGKFTNGGDYFEGDLAREPKPKVAFGVAYSNNEDAVRSGGQLGKYLYDPRDIGTGIVDFLFKHNGWSFAAEYIQRNATNPVTMNVEGDVRFVYVGHGQNFQGGYLFRNNFEIVGRYSKVRPDSEIQTLTQMKQQYAMGATKYIRGHRLKIQSDLTYEDNTWLSGPNQDQDYWMWRFQIEIGI